MKPSTLEFFIEETLFLDDDQRVRVVALLEPVRDEIEFDMHEFEDDCPCWKIFCEELWARYVDPPLRAQIDTIIDE